MVRFRWENFGVWEQQTSLIMFWTGLCPGGVPKSDPPTQGWRDRSRCCLVWADTLSKLSFLALSIRRVVKLKCNCAVRPKSSGKSPVFPVVQLCLAFPYYAVSRVSSLPSSTPIIGFYVPQYCNFNVLDHDSRSQGLPGAPRTVARRSLSVAVPGGPEPPNENPSKPPIADTNDFVANLGLQELRNGHCL